MFALNDNKKKTLNTVIVLAAIPYVAREAYESFKRLYDNFKR